MVNQKRHRPVSPTLEQPERKRGRPAGKNRIALSEEERRARNAFYERERRGIEATLMTDLAQAAGLDSDLPKMVILNQAAQVLERGWESRRKFDIIELKRVNENLMLEIKNAKELLRSRQNAQEFLSSDSESEEGSDSEERDLSSSSDTEERVSSFSSDLEEDLASPDLEEDLASPDLEEDLASADLEVEDIGTVKTEPHSSSIMAEDRDLRTVAEELTSNEHLVPYEPMLSDTAIPDDLDVFYFDLSTGSLPSTSSIFSEDGSMSTRSHTGRNTPAQG